MQDRLLHSRLTGTVALCANAIEVGGQRLVPDDTKGYCEFRFGYGFPVATAYGTQLHPGTLANSWPSLIHQVFNLGHKMRAYDTSKERKEIPRDYILGVVVAAEFPNAPAGGWRVTHDRDRTPSIRAAATIIKNAERVPAVLGEHLGGRHKWTVSMEIDYHLLQSGFVVGRREQAKKPAAALMAETTPREFDELGYGYIPVEQSPEDLLACYSFEKRRIVGEWDGLPVTLLKGGINGQIHFMGVGLVRYGAEREAEVQQILASDPDRLDELSEDHAGLVAGYFRSVQASAETITRLLG